MIQLPVVAGLMLCERIDVDVDLARMSLLGIFQRRKFQSFPSSPYDFTVYAALSDGAGEGTMAVTITQLSASLVVHSIRKWFVYPERMLVVNLEVRVHGCVFPSAGRHSVELSFDAQPVTEWAFEVVEE